ncbi:saccharopine dehydrogenase family protein [Marinicella sp. W31]|uniref:saccharopine dehydrogenase family protein n=1 Tax=Marinicella sp. W31 TaxID=3023713 RepID=UPI003757D23D
MKNILIYGANGYSGRLILEEALKHDLKPILAGRNADAIEGLSKRHDLEHRVFSLDSVSEVSQQLKDVAVVIHCAGPFSATAENMMRACIDSGTHYTDITGEISVFELGWTFNQDAEKAGVVVCPGVGFDVIPTDCVAVKLKNKMPDAIELSLGFDSRSGFSPGTAKTSVEGLANGGAVRLDGEITRVKLAHKTRNIDFGGGEKLSMTIPWGDVSTAYRSTGIPNISVYIPSSPKQVSRLKKLNWVRPLLGLGFVQNFMKNKIEKSVKGPNAQKRSELVTYVWGEVRNAEGQTESLRIKVANGYDVTATGAIAVARYLLTETTDKGYKTPAMLMGDVLVDGLPGSEYLAI